MYAQATDRNSVYSPEAVSAPPGELILGTGKWTIPTPVRISPLRTAPHHLRTSSANVFFSVSEFIMMENRKGLKADPWWSPTSTAKGSLVPAAHLTTLSH